MVLLIDVPFISSGELSAAISFEIPVASTDGAHAIDDSQPAIRLHNCLRRRRNQHRSENPRSVRTA